MDEFIIAFQNGRLSLEQQQKDRPAILGMIQMWCEASQATYGTEGPRLEGESILIGSDKLISVTLGQNRPGCWPVQLYGGGRYPVECRTMKELKADLVKLASDPAFHQKIAELRSSAKTCACMDPYLILTEE